MPFRRLEFRLKTSFVVQGITTPLNVVIDEPVGWSAVNIVAERDPDYHGFSVNYSDGKVQLEFRCESAYSLLSTQYYTYGNDAVVKFHLVDIRTDGSETIRYSGKIDFNDVDIEPGRVRANLIDDGIGDKISARWDTPIALDTKKTLDNSPITPPSAVEIGLPGQALREKAGFTRNERDYKSERYNDPSFIQLYSVFPNLIDPSGVPPESPGNDPVTGQPLPGTPSLGSMAGVTPFNGGAIEGPPDDFPLITCTTAGEYKLKFSWLFRFDITCYKKILDVASPYALITLWSVEPLLVVVRPNEPSQFIQLCPPASGQNAPTSTPMVTMDCRYDGTLNVTQGTRIYLTTKVRVLCNCRATNLNITQLSVNIQLERVTRAVDSRGFAYLLPDALKHVFGAVTNALTGGTGSVTGSLISKASGSQAQDGYATEYAIASGFQLRNLNTKAPVLSLKELIGVLSAHHVAGYQHKTDANGKHSIQVEAGEYFYRGGQIMVVDEVDDPEVFSYSETPNVEMLVNQIKVGYEKFPDSGPGVLDEFNTERTYQTPIVTNQKTKEIKCPLIAAGSAIEEARRMGVPEYDENGKLIDKSRDGGPYDEDVFLLHVATRSFTGYVQFIVINIPVFPFKSGVPIHRFILPDTAEKLKPGDKITFTGTGTANDNVTYTVGTVGTTEQGKTIYTVGFGPAMVAANAPDATWTQSNQPVKIRTNERLDVYGVPEPATTYNLELSPVRMLRRWSAFLNSGFRYKKATEELRCTDYKGNRVMYSRVKTGFTLPGDTDKQVVYETANIALGEFERFNKIFSPEVIPTRAHMTPAQVDELLLALRDLHPDEDKNMGFMTIRNSDGQLRDGFVMKLSYNPTSEVAELTLNKKFDGNTLGGVDCTLYSDWIYNRFENDLTADPNFYRFCRFRDYL